MRLRWTLVYLCTLRLLLLFFFPVFTSIIWITACRPTNPVNGALALGTRLSMEDFMILREFCIILFNQEILPCIERRLAVLNKQVSDSRKGFKNVVKSFWRKPRDEAESSRGGLKYRYDKIESQILLLADTSFMIRDYETALTMYKYVRDDYKSDKVRGYTVFAKRINPLQDSEYM